MSAPEREWLPSKYLRDNFYTTTSGNFCAPAFARTLEVMGPERVMISADCPMDDNVDGATFLAGFPMDDAVRRQVAAGNALRLFGDRIPLVQRVTSRPPTPR